MTDIPINGDKNRTKKQEIVILIVDIMAYLCSLEYNTDTK